MYKIPDLVFLFLEKFCVGCLLIIFFLVFLVKEGKQSQKTKKDFIDIIRMLPVHS